MLYPARIPSLFLTLPIGSAEQLRVPHADPPFFNARRHASVAALFCTQPIAPTHGANHAH